MDRKSWSIQKMTIDNATDLARLIRGSDMELVSFQPGQAGVDLKQLSIRDFSVRQWKVGPAFRLRGAEPNRIILGVALKQSGRMTHWWKETQPGDIVIVPPGTEFDAIFADGKESLSISLPLSEFVSALASENELADPEYWKQKRICRASLLIGEGIQRHIRETIAAIEHYVADPNSEIASSGFWQHALLECFVTALAHSRPCPERPSSTDARLVTEVENFVDTTKLHSASVAEICKTLNVPRRTLYRAFIDRLGIGPMTYLRYRRLATIRSILKQSDDGARIGKLAARYGFTDKGRFAAYYQAQYGERPSQFNNAFQRKVSEVE